MSAMTVEFSLQSEMMTTLRLTTGGVASAAGLSFDDGEDCKVCVTESLLLLSHAGFKRARVCFETENGLRVLVEGLESGMAQPAQEDEISVALLSALAGDVTMEKSGGQIAKIRFRFGLGS